MYSKDLYILHFNDVYDIQEQTKEPIGGAARFSYTLNSLQDNFNTLTLFSGDIFAPSALSNIYRGIANSYIGDQMLYPIEQFKIDVACPGNHDFDYPLERVESLFQRSKIPWVLSNVFNAQTNQNFAHTMPHYTKICSIGEKEIKIGFLGLAENEWLHQIVEIPQELIAYEDFLHCAERTVKYLRDEENCELIIALTHMRVPNDRNLMEKLTQKVDIVLGGHDHMIYCENIHGSLFMKSGSNFKNLGIIRISLNEFSQPEIMQFISSKLSNENDIIKQQSEMKLKSANNYYIQTTVINIVGSLPQNQDMRLYVDEKLIEYNKQKSKAVCLSNCDLEGTFHEVRNKETNLANLYADILKLEFDTEISFFNSGTLRVDDVVHKGIISYLELDKIFAIPDLVVSFWITGEDLLKMLENGIGKWPNYDGRFLGVSGISLIFDPSKPTGHRVVEVKINNEPLDINRKYKASSQRYISLGFDGFLKIPDEDYIIGWDAEIQIMHIILGILDICRMSDELQLLDIKQNEIKSLEQLNLHHHRIYHFKQVIKGLTRINNEICTVIEPQLEDRITKI